MSQCAVCGTQTRFGMGHCDRCWELVNTVGAEEARRRISSRTETSATGQPATHRGGQSAGLSPFSDRRVTLAVVGTIAGAVIGFLTRPSVFLVGQLPFSVVVFRGGNLSGLDQVLVPAAQASFNQLLFGMLLGGAAGFGAPFIIRLLNSAALGGVASTIGSTSPDSSDVVKRPTSAEVLNNDAVLSLLKAGLGEDVVLEKMKQSRCVFSLSAPDLAQLKQGGVSDRIITAMLQNQSGSSV